jgi:hypothetical protein
MLKCSDGCQNDVIVVMLTVLQMCAVVIHFNSWPCDTLISKVCLSAMLFFICHTKIKKFELQGGPIHYVNRYLSGISPTGPNFERATSGNRKTHTHTYATE